jgi:hypothetical protein
MRSVVLVTFFCAAATAQVCSRTDLSGAYGFRLAGTSTIAGTPKPIAAVGRLVFESGRITGTSSVNFDGLFLGNPVTGTYAFQEANCSITFELQDDSGAWQRFGGTLAPGGQRGQFHQTDPGAGGSGSLERTPDTCNAGNLRGRYTVSIGSQKTTTVADGNGNLSWSSGDAQNNGTYQVDSDCFVEVNFGVRLRGVIVNGGRTVLAVQADPGKVATATFNAQ